MAYVLVNWFFFLQCYEVKWKKVKSLSRVWLFATPWTIACQAPLAMRFSRQEYWSGLPCYALSLMYLESKMLFWDLLKKTKLYQTQNLLFPTEPDFPPIFSISVMAVPSANPLNKGTGSYSASLVHTILLPAPYSSGLQLCWFWHLTTSWKGSFFFRFTSSPLVEALIISLHCFSIIKG